VIVPRVTFPLRHVLVNAAASVSATIQQQLETLRSDPSPAELAEKTIDYSEAKTCGTRFNPAEATRSKMRNRISVFCSHCYIMINV
jgi:hypothetical protein